MKTKRKYSEFIHPLLMNKVPQSTLATLKRFKLAQITTSLFSELQLAETQSFQLGDRILTFSMPLSSEPLLIDRQERSGCYLVCDGRIRLLYYDVRLDRLAPATVLEVGEVFGADDLFCSTPLPYSAIAATACQIAYIPNSQLALLQARKPQLQQYFNQLAQQRERLIFFKSLTQLRSYPSHFLKQVLLPQLTEQYISAGEYLATATPATSGCFWLRKGQVCSESLYSVPPTIGDSWGYPNSVPNDWVAETDLVVYRLLFDRWEAA